MVDKQVAVDLVENGFGIGEPYNGLTVVAVNSVGKGRWVEYMQLVIKDDFIDSPHLYAAVYSVGLTENQDSEPFEDHSDPVEFKPVWKVTKIVEEVTYQDDKDTVRSMMRDGAHIEMYAQPEIEDMP